MSDSTTEPKEFVVKLKYKVGNESHYITLEKFDFDTIRDSNMYDREKQVVKEKIKRIKKKIWSNTAEDFKELKDHLTNKDISNNYKFIMPLSTNYYTFENLQGFLNEKKISLKNNSNNTFDLLQGIEKNINELKTNTQVINKVNSFIRKQIMDDNKDYIFSLNEIDSGSIILEKLFTREMLINLGYINQTYETTKDIGNGKYFIYRFLYLIFRINLQEYFSRNEKLFDLTNNSIFTDSKAQRFLNNCKKDGNIIMFHSLDNIEIILENLKYLEELSKRREQAIPEIKSLKNCINDNVNNISGINYTSTNKYKQSSKNNQKINEILLIRKAGQEFILERINLVVGLLRSEFDNEISNELSEYKKFDENKSKLFLKSITEENKYLKKYFEFLEDNLIKNDQYNFSRSGRLDRPLPHNTDEGRKQKVREYGKYILDKEEYENSDINKIYDKLKADPRRLSYIITYYNIFKILETFFLTNGCILHHKFFNEEINLQDGIPQIKKSKEKIYVKVKSIKCIKYNEEMLRESFEGDAILKPIYEIEFEQIPTYSNVIFYINLINKLDPSSQLEETLENYKSENPNDEKTITDINSETLIYKRHTNDMFSKNKNIHPTKIFINNNLDIKKLVNRFSIIKSNHKIFKSLQVKTIEDALMISDTFTSITKEKELINDKNSEDVAYYIFKYYVDRFYFEIDKHLFIDGKYAQIKKIKLRLLNKMSWDELKDNKLDPTTKGFVYRQDREKEERFYDVQPSKTTRLAVNNEDSSYYVYLDVEVVFKNSPNDRIPIKDQINYGNNCIGKATVLDKLLYFQLGLNYPKRYLENKLRKKHGSLQGTRKKTLLKSAQLPLKTKEEEVSIKSQSGGTNKNLTRKIISKQKNRTIKNLLHYYTI